MRRPARQWFPALVAGIFAAGFTEASPYFLDDSPYYFDLVHRHPLQAMLSIFVWLVALPGILLSAIPNRGNYSLPLAALLNCGFNAGLVTCVMKWRQSRARDR